MIFELFQSGRSGRTNFYLLILTVVGGVGLACVCPFATVPWVAVLFLIMLILDDYDQWRRKKVIQSVREGVTKPEVIQGYTHSLEVDKGWGEIKDED